MLKCSKLFLNILYKTRKSKPVLLDALIIPLRKMSLSLDLRRKFSVPPMTEMSRFGFFMSQTSSNKWSTSPIFVSASIRTYYPKINKIPKSNVWYLWFYMIEIELYQKKIVKMITTLYHIHLLIIISNSTHWQDKITPNNNTYALDMFVGLQFQTCE